MVSWTGILDRVGKKGSKGKAAKAAALPRAAELAEYHMLRRWFESLETRQLLAATYGGFTFTSSPTNASAETALQTVFTNKTGSQALTGTISAAGQSFSGTFTVTGNGTTTFSISASSVNISLPGNLIQITNGSASLSLTTGGFTGSISNGPSFSIGGGLSMTVSSLSLAWDTQGGHDNDLKVGVSGSLNLGGGQAITGGTFTFERNGSNVSASVSGAALSLGGGMLSATGLNATLDLTSSGIKANASVGVASSFSAGGASFSGNLALALDTTYSDPKDDYVRLTADNMQITVGGVTFQGDFGFQQVKNDDGTLVTDLIGVSIADVDISLKDNNNTTVVHVTSPAGDANAGTFLFQKDQNGDVHFGGMVKGTVNVAAGGGVTASGTVVLMVNTDTNTASFPDPLNMTQSLEIPGGPMVRAYARDIDLNVSGSQAIHGDFGFEANSDGGVKTVTVSANNVNATFGAAQLTSASGSLTIAVPSGGTSLTGSVAGAISFSGGGVTSSGDFYASFDGTGTHIGADNVNVIVHGQTFAGSFSVDAQPTSTTFTVTDASLQYGSGLLTVTDLTGSFTVNSGGTATGTVSGTMAASIGQASFSGGLAVGFGSTSLTLSGTNDVLTIGDESISGSFSITDDGAGTLTISATDVSANLGGGLVTVDGASLSVTATSGSVVGTFTGEISAGAGLTAASFSGQVTVTIAPDAISASGTNDHFTVNGQTFDADFTFSKDSQGLALGISGVGMDLGNGAITVSNASGTLLIPSDKSGITGSISATFSSSLASFTGHLDISFSPGAFALAATGVSLTVGGQSLSGDMGITVNGSDLEFTADNLSASLGGGLVTISPPPAGVVVPPTTLKISGGVFSGSFAGMVSAGTASGVGFSGLVTVAVDSNSITATGTDNVLTIGGQQITANFSFSKVGSDLQLHIDGVNFAIGTLLSVNNASGDLVVGPSGLTGSASGVVTSGIANFTGGLSVGFAPGVLKLSGTNDKLTFGDQFVSGDFNFVKDSAGLHLSISNFTADLGSGLVMVTGGSATLEVDQASGAVSGSFSGTVASGTTLDSLGVSFGGSISVSVGNGVIKASGTNDTLSIAGNTFSTSFDFYKDANGLEVSVKGLSFTLGSVLSVVGASGTLKVTSAGLVGSTTGNVTSTLAGLSGTFGVGFAPGKLQISGTNDSLTIGGQSLAGDFVFTANGPDLDLDISNLTANMGGGLVRVGGQNGTGATAHLTVSGGQIVGDFSGYLGVGTGTGFSFGGAVAVHVDSAASAITASATGAKLTIAGQTLTGDFTFAKNGSNLEVTIANVGLSVGGVISVSNVNGTVTVGATGISGTVNGTIGQSLAGLTADSFGIGFAPGVIQISATNAALNIGGQTLSGDFNFRQDNTGLRLTSSNITAKLGGGLVKVAGGAANLAISNGNVTGGFSGNVSVDSGMTGGVVGFAGLVTVQVAPGSITASGTGDTLTVAGYQLTTDFTFAKDASGLKLTISHLNFSLGGALTISEAGGTLLVTSGGVTGSAFGTVSSNIAGVTIFGSLGVAFAPGTLSISGTNNYLEAAGQKVSGDFNFTKDATGLHLTAANFTASLGDGLVTVDNGSGTLDVANGAITGSFSGTLHAGTVGGGVSFGGPINVSVSPGGISASTGAGQVDTLTIGSQQISAGFSFVKTAAGLELTVSDLTATLGPVSLTDGGGTLIVSAAGVSGTAYGTLSTSFTGFSFTGSLAAAFSPGSFKLSGTNNKLTVGDQSISGDFSFLKDGTGVHLAADNISASLGGGVVSITNGSGTLDVDAGGALSGSFAATVAAGTGTSGFSFGGTVSVAVAPGSITASGTNNTLTVLGNSMSADFYFHKDASGLELDVSHVNLSFAGGTVAVNDAGGTLLVTKTGVSGSLHGGLSASVPNVTFNSTNFDISFATGSLAISGTGVSLTAYGQSISGNFSFASNASSVSLHIDSLSLSLGGVVNVTNGTGDFTLTKGAGGGMVGSASGNVQIAGVGPDVQFGGTFSVSVGNNTVSVAGTGTSLTLFGQKLSGNFSFTKTPTAVNFHVSSLNLNLGNGLVLVTGGAADFNIDSGGLTGSASGTLSVGAGLSGVSFGGTVAVTITHTGLSVVGTKTQVTIAGQTLSADQITFARDNATGTLAASITNLGLTIDGDPTVQANGSLLVAPTGLSGTLTANANLGGVNGTISVNFGNGQYTVTAGVNASFSENIGPVAISGTISAQGSSGGSASISLTDLSINMGNGLLTVTGGSASFDYAGGKISGTATGTVSLNGVPGVTLGGTVTVTITKVGATSTISVVGTNMNLSVLGQTLAGNFSFTDSGNGTIALAASNVSVSLADSISLTNGAASFTLGKAGANAGLKGTGSGNLSVSLPGVGFSTAFGLTIDNTGGQSLFKVAANPMTITVGGVGLTGSFVVQKVTTPAGKTTVSIVASDIDTFLGDGTTGLHISNAGGSILVLPTGTAIDVYGSAALEGIDGLTLGGTLHVRMNNTGAAVNQTVPAPDPAHPGQTINQTLSFAGNQTLLVSGTATLGIGDGSGNTFVSLSGGFSFSTQSSTAGNVTTTKLLVGAAGIDAFLGTGDPSGSDAMGVKVSGANLGLAVISTNNSVTSAHTSAYALTASGNAALLGVPVLSLSGSLAVRSNTAGTVHEVVQVPDPANPGSTIPVNIDFAGNMQAFAGSVALGLADPGDPTKQFVSLSGDFSFSRAVVGTTTKVTAAVNNASAFVGIGGANPIGIQLTGGSLGLVMLKTGTAAGTYALAAGGNVAIVGLPGLFVGGNIAIRSNTTGSSQPNPAGGASIPAGGPVITVDDMTVAIRDSDNHDIISISVDATIQKTGSVVDINATSATFAINAGAQPLIAVSGSVEFTLGAAGLNLGPAGFQITGLSVLGGAMEPVTFPGPPVPGAPASGATANGPTTTSSGTGGSTASTGTGASITLPGGVPTKLGPLSLYNLKPAFNGFSFSGGQLSANVGLKADAASLALGSAAGSTNGPNAGGVTALMTGFQGTLGLALGLDLSSFKVTNFGPTGAFDFHATNFVLDVPKVLNVSASNIDIHYDPKATTPQKVLSIGTATITVPIGPAGQGIQGQIAPALDSNGKTLPGLEIWSDHLQLGRATLKYVGSLSIGSLVQITNPSVSVTDLYASFDGALDFGGSITIGADAVKLGPSAFQFTGTSVAATLTQSGGDWGFSFKAGTLGVSVASVVSLSATNVSFNPGASGSETLLSVSSLNASLALSKLTLTGTAGAGPGETMKILGDGTLSLPDNFAIGVNFSAGSSGELGWPSWIPIQISSILLQWPHFNADKTDFTITFSAHVGGTYGPITLAGDLNGVTIDVKKLINGQFPITDIDSGVITAGGPAFGGDISGTLILGVVKLDALNHQVQPGDPYDHTIFYAGIMGHLTTPSFGLAMRFGISEKGPLEAYVQADVDIPVFPPIGLAIKSLYGGISFDAQPFPNISNAMDLKSPVFETGVELSTDQWQKQLRQAVVNQAGGGSGGYLFTVSSDLTNIVAGLDSNNITATLSSEFLSYGFVLSSSTSSAASLGTPAPSVVKEVAGQEWLIKDGTKYYLLTKNLAGTIQVSKYRFVIDPTTTGAKGTVSAIATITAALNAGAVTPDVVTSFQAYGIYLSTAATVKADAPSAPGQPVTSWTITDGSFTYHVEKDAGGLLTVDSAGGSMSGMGGVIRITAGITLGIQGMPPEAFSASGEIVIETDGKIMFNANATFGGAAKFNFRSFIDLSTVSSGHLVALFYFEQIVTVGPFTFPRLVIAAGVEFGLTDADNHIIDPNGSNADATPVGFGVKLSGEIDYYQLPDVGLKLNGNATLVFTPTEAVLTFNATLSATITSFIQANNVVTAAGSFTMRYGGGPFAVWGAAEIRFDSGAIPFLENAGIRANAEIFLRINTDDAVQNVEFDLPAPGGGPAIHESFDLQPGSFGLYLVGELTFKKGPINFVMGGIFSVDFVYQAATHDFRFDMFVFAHLKLGIGDQTLLTTDALGLLEVSNDGFAAMLAVQVAAGTDAGTGKQLFTFDFDFTLFTNTTGREVTYTLPSDLTDIIKQQDGATSAGDDGLIASLTLVLNRLDDKYGSGNGDLVSVDGTTGDLTIKVPAGMPRIDLLGNYQGQAPDGPYFVVQGAGNIEVLETFQLSGSFVIQASADGVAVGAQAKLHLGPIADLAASGFININSDGVYAALTLASTINLGGFASFKGAAVLEVNTTGLAQTVKEYTYDDATGTISNTPVDVVIPANQKFRLDIKGRLQLAGFFDLHGEFQVIFSAGSVTTITIGISAHVNAFFGLDVSVGGSAKIQIDGSSIAFAASVKANVSVNLAGLVEISAGAYFEINTFGSTQNVPDPDNLSSTVPVAPGVLVRLDGHLKILSLLEFDVVGQVDYNAITHVFTLQISASTHINLFIFDATLNVGGWLDSTGQFAVGVSGGVGIDVGIAGLNGSAYLYVAYMAGGSPTINSSTHLPGSPPADRSGTRVLTIGGGGHLDIHVFGITLVGVDIDFRVNSNLDISFHAVAHLNFLLFSVDIGFTVNVGSFSGKKPDQVYLAGIATAGQVAPSSFGGGQLVVNAGSRAGYRNYQNSDHNETITIQGSDYNASTKTQTIYITINGYTQTYKNVSSVVIPGDGAETINILNTVAVPVSASIGAGGKVFNASTGAATLTGSSGNDLIESGSGATTIVGGGGSDTIVIGSGSANVTTTGGNSRLLWNSDTSGNVTWNASGGSDKLIATANTPGTSYASGESLSLTKIATNTAKLAHVGGNAITLSNVPNVLLSALGGGNTMTIGDMVGAGVASLSISYGQTHGLGNSLSIAGSTGADTYTLSSSTAALPAIPSVDNLNPGPSSITVPTNAIARTGGLSITVYGTSATSGDAIAINSKGGNDTFYLKSVSVPTTLQGNDASATMVTPYSTYYYVGWQGTNVKGTLSSVTALLSIKGSAGKDVLVMDDTADFYNRNFSLTDTQLVSDALGTGGRLVYDNKMDNFNLFAGPGHNTYVIAGTGAVGQTQINGGDTDLIINAPLAAPLAVNGGDALGALNTLTVNGTFAADFFTVGAGYVLGAGAPLYFTNFHTLTLNGNGGDDTYTIAGSNIPVTIVGSAGNETFTLNGNAAPVTINSGTGSDTFVVSGATAPVSITAGANGNFTVNGNAATTALVGGPGVNTFNVYANSGNLTLTGGNGLNAFNTFNVFGNSLTLSANANGGGANLFNVTNIASPVSLTTGNAPATLHVSAPLYAPVNITGGTTVQTLVVDGTEGPNAFTLTTTQVKGAGANINYTGLMAVTINGLGGDDTFLISSNNGPTTINAGLGNSTFTVQTLLADLTINTGAGISTSTINLATKLSQLQGAVTITGTGTDTLNISDAANTLGGVGELTDTTLTGFGMAAGGITFTGIQALNLNFGSGADTLGVNAVSNATTAVVVNTAGGDDTVNLAAVSYPLTLSTGTGTNTINAGDLAPTLTGGKLVKLQGAISIDGTAGATTLNLDNTGDTSPQVANLTASALTGLGMGSAGITYTALASLNLSLGSGGNAVTIAATAAATVTSLTGGTGTDVFDVVSTAGPFIISTGSGNTTVNVAVLNAMQGAISVTGNGSDTLNIDDSADTSDKTGTLSSSQLTGFGLAAGGISYSTVDTLNVMLGSGNLNVLVTSTAAGTATTLTTGSGNDTITVDSTGPSPTTILAGAGDDTVHIHATTGITTVAVGTGTNSVDVHSYAGMLDTIQGALNLTGNGTDTITLDDTGSSADKTVTLSGTAVTATGSATITYAGDTGLATLNLNLGSGISSLTILTTRAGATTNVTTGSASDVVSVTTTGGTTKINTGGGDDSVTVRATGAATTINTGAGTNTVLVGSTTNTLDGIQGAMTVVGSGSDAFTLNDSGSPLGRTGNVTATAVTGFGMGTAGVTYSGLATLNLLLGSGGTALTLTDTTAATITNVTAATGNDAFTLLNNHGTLNVTTSAGGTNTVAVAATSAAVNITSGAGAHDTVTVGSSQSTSNVAGTLTLSGNGSTVVIIDDSATSAMKTAALTASNLTGLSPAGIAYSGLSSLAIKLGTGGGVFTISNTNAATPTTLTGGSGNETIVVNDTASNTTINPGAGTNTIAVRATHAPVAINSALTAVDAITLSSAGLTSGLNAPVTVSGNGAVTLTIDDSANTSARTVAVTAAAVTGAAPAAVNYTGVATLNVLLGSAADSVTITNTAAATTTNVSAGAGNDTLSVTNAAGPLNLDTGAGANMLSVLASSAAITIFTPSNGSTATTLGDAHSIDAITAPVSVTGPGSLLLDDAANTTAKSVTLTATKITGLTLSAISYTGLTTLTLSTGVGDDIVTVSSTAAGTPTTVNTNGGDDAVSVSFTNSPLTLNTGAGTNLINFSDLPSFNGPVSVTGSGFDILTLDESANAANSTGTLSATQITGLSPSPISYAGIATLTLTFGSGSNSLSVKSSSANTVLSSGTGTDHITVGFTAPATGGVMSNINGPLSVLGNANDTLTLDDSGSSAGKTIAVTAKRVTGLSPAPVNFSNLAQLALLLGSGNDSVTVADTSAGSTSVETGGGNDAVIVQATTNALSIATGAGDDVVVVQSVSNAVAISTGAGTNTVSASTPDAIDGQLSVNGAGGATTFNIDASSQTSAHTVTLTFTSLAGVTPVPVSFSDLDVLNLTLGSGDDQVRVESVPTSATTNLNAGAGNDAVSLVPTQFLTGVLNLNGASGSNTLALNLSAIPWAVDFTYSAATIDGIGPTIGYANFASLSTSFGSASNSLSVTGPSPSLPVTVVSAGPLAANLHFDGDFTGNLSLPSTSTINLSIDGSLLGTLTTAGAIASATIGYDLAGTLITASSLSSLTVGHNLSGYLQAADITSATVGNDLSGTIVVPGKLQTLTINGNDTGSISAGSIGTIYLPNAHAGSDGTVFSATQAGVRRSVSAFAAGGAGMSAVSFAIAYDGSTGTNPSAAIRVTNGAPGAQRFDLVLNTPYGADPFDLSRLDSASGARANVRNVVVSGSLLKAMTPAQVSLLGTAAVTSGGVYLPADNLATVSVRRNLPASSIAAKSIQAISFASLTGLGGDTHPSIGVAPTSKYWKELLKSILVIDPTTRKPYAKVVALTETLRVIADAHDNGLFIGKMTGKSKSLFDPHTLFISDQAFDENANPVQATIDFAKKPKAGRPVITHLAFTGAGATVTTTNYVDRITSTGTMTDISINAGKKETLVLEAPALTGKVDLFGGKLITDLPVKSKPAHKIQKKHK